MAIEFRCTQCNKLLRTGEGTAGKQAKCPECGAVSTIPPAGTALPGEPPPSEPKAPPPVDEAGTPFAPGGPQPAPFDPENPYAAPGEYTPAAPSYAPAPGALRHTIIDFGDVFSRTWEIFKVQWGMCLVVILIVGVINFVVNMVVSGVCQIIGMAAGDPAVAFMFSLSGNVLTTLFSVWIGIGEGLYFLKVARGQSAELSDIFTGWPYFLSVVLAGLIVGMITLVILAVCILPCALIGLAISEEAAMGLGVVGLLVGLVPCTIVGLMFSQFYYLILDGNLGAIDALKISKEITTGNKLTLFLIGLAEGGLVILGLLACCVGVLPVATFITLLAPVIYLVMTGQRTADQMLPRQPTAP